jgi:hypothetical protein
VSFHGALGQEQPGRDLPVGEVLRDEPRYLQLPAGEFGLPRGLGGRPGWLPALGGEGDTLVDRHRAAAGERRVERLLAKPMDGDRRRPLVLLAVQLDQRQRGRVAHALRAAEEDGGQFMRAALG